MGVPGLNLARLLRPYRKPLAVASAAILIEAATDLAEPWPLKVIFDYVLGSKRPPPWLSWLGSGHDRLTLLDAAAVAVVAIAIIGAISSFTEKYLSTTVAKRVGYPMLLAQFIGIVHEIKPRFLQAPAPAGFDRHQHLPPTLMALGHFSGNAAAIARAYAHRSILLCIAENFDVRIAAHRKGTCSSPLYWDRDDITTVTVPVAAASTGVL